MIDPQPARQAPSGHTRSFHHWPAEYAEHSIDNGIRQGTLTTDDAALIRAFVAEVKATRGICQGRANKLVFNIVAWRKFIGPFRENTIGDLYVGIDRLNQARFKGKPYKTNTKRDQLLVPKRFYKWLIENQCSTVPEKKINAIHAPGTDRMTKVAADLLDETEIRAMLDACQNSRDRAIMATLYDGGFRVETIGSLTWGQLKFDDYGTVVNINEKTGQARYVRLVGATQYLNQWRNDYPFPVTPEAPVFLSLQKLPLEYGAILRQLKRIGARAGLTKNITAHLFRHSKITHMIRAGYSESVVKMEMWGRLDTMMFATYVHLVNTDIDDEILRKQGIRRPDTHRPDPMAVKQCPNCNTVNPALYEFCSHCAEPLDERVRMSMMRLEKDIERTPEYQEYMTITRRKQIAGP